MMEPHFHWVSRSNINKKKAQLDQDAAPIIFQQTQELLVL